MKTIEPNSNENVVDLHVRTSIELKTFIEQPSGNLNLHEFSNICIAYDNVLKMLEKNIKERGLIN